MDEVTIIDGKVFKCDQCGECCKHVSFIDTIKNYDRGDGVCQFLNDNNLCSIYNERPDVCRGVYVYHKYFEGMPVDDYYNMIYRYCKMIKEGKMANERFS